MGILSAIRPVIAGRVISNKSLTAKEYVFRISSNSLFTAAAERVGRIAEAIATPQDVVDMMANGFDGAQVGTRFICTEESGIDPASKQVYVKAKEEDIVLMHSPIGLPVKVLRTPLVDKLLRGEQIPFGCPFLCLRSCEADKAKFCIAEALVHTMFGETDKGLFMVGSANGRINDIIPVEEFLGPLRRMAE